MRKTEYVDNAKAQTPESQTLITPERAVELLQKGNERFLKNKRLYRKYDDQIAATSHGQYPFAVVLSCIDSRVPTEILFDQGIGDLFNACVAGNFVNEDILGSIEYACKFAGVKLIVIMGHTSCGAIKGACDGVKAGNLTQLLDKLMPAVDATKTPKKEDRSSKNLDFVNRVSAKNVELTAADTLTKSSVLKELHDEGTIKIVQAMYDVTTGKVDFL